MTSNRNARRRLSTGSRVWLLFTAALVAVGAATLLFPGQRPPGFVALPAFDLQGHRGARGHFPENSLPGFEAALAMGVTTLEMDIGMTRDGVFVVHNGRRLDPEHTRGPDGAWLAGEGPAIYALARAELAAYDVGRLHPDSEATGRFPKQSGLDRVRIPDLSAVLARAEALSGGRIRYSIEIRTSPLAPDETAAPEVLAERLVARLEEAGVARRSMVQSFDWRALQRVQDLAPDLPTVYLTVERRWRDNLERGRPGVSPWTAGFDIDAFDGSTARAVEAAGGRIWSPYYRDLRTADLAEAQRLGLRVVVWTVNDPGDMASLIDLGVDGIVTDYPDRLRRVMADKGLVLPPRFGAGA